MGILDKIKNTILGENPADKPDTEEFDNSIILQDENGEDVSFEFLDLIDYNNDQYVVLLPVDDEDGEVIILMVDSSDDSEEETYLSVENIDTLNAVFEIFKEKNKNYFNFTD